MSQQIFFEGGPQKRTIQSKDIDMIAAAMSGDIIFTLTPATLAGVAGTTARSRTVNVAVTDAAGSVHRWFNKAITTGVSIADTSTAGVSTIPSTTLTFVNGECSVVISSVAAAWVAAETNTLTVAQATILGVTVAAKTSVETIA